MSANTIVNINAATISVIMRPIVAKNGNDTTHKNPIPRILHTIIMMHNMPIINFTIIHLQI